MLHSANFSDDDGGRRKTHYLVEVNLGCQSSKMRDDFGTYASMIISKVVRDQSLSMQGREPEDI